MQRNLQYITQKKYLLFVRSYFLAIFFNRLYATNVNVKHVCRDMEEKNEYEYFTM
jgi:hypothetical protein